MTYTLDGSMPTFTSPRIKGPIQLNNSTTLRVVVSQGTASGGQLASAHYDVRYQKPYRHRAFVKNVKTPSGRPHRLDWTGLEIGKRHYTDRDYYITSVPPEIDKLPYIQMANNDDRSTGNNWLSFDIADPCTIIVGTDKRNPEPLAWMKIGQPNEFELTEGELATNDAVFRLYRKQFPVGKVTLGGNTNDPKTDSGRGNYIVIFDRKILPDAPNKNEVTIEQVLQKMSKADPEKGRELFLHPKGAGCFKCHRMETIGGVFAPDLSDIGSRAKTAKVLIESILKPSKVITEGFAQQIIDTIDGKSYSGAVVEETSRTLKIVDSNAIVKVIDKTDIEERSGSKVSPMPDGFGKMMTAQQVADLTAWLMIQKNVGDQNGFWFNESEDLIDINYKKQRIATYLKKHDKLTRRALVNVMTPGGIKVTRNFPPRKPEDIDPGYKGENGIIHPHMHAGIWLGYGDVNGHDYWRLQSKVIFDSFTKKLTGGKDTARFTAKNLFMSKDGKHVVCTELTEYEFKVIGSNLQINISAEYKSDNRDFYFGDQEESGLAIRVASPIRVTGGNGTIVNNRGEKNGKEIWGKEAAWFDYFGTIKNRNVGIMVVSNPKNPRPSWLHARDYGVIVTNPFPKQPKERREPYIKTWIKKRETFKLSYAILIHDQPQNNNFNRKKAANELLKSFNK